MSLAGRPNTDISAFVDSAADTLSLEFCSVGFSAPPAPASRPPWHAFPGKWPWLGCRAASEPSGGQARAQILTDVSLSIRRGAVVALVGASGAGKSTLLRLACRLADPTEGSIRFNGVDICGIPVLKLRVQVSMVFQLPTMLPGTVQDNILYGPRLAMNDAGVGRASAGTDTSLLPDARALLDQVGLAPDLLDRPAADLSVGQQQRVCIARSLANQPEVLLLDEPTSALDPVSARGILQLVQNLNRERSLTVLMVTHILDHARIVAHDAAVMDKGRVVLAGPASILDDSASAIVPLMADQDPAK